MNPILELIYFEAGGGHRSAAIALQTVIAGYYPNWQVRLVNLVDILHPADPASILTNNKYQSHEVYNKYLEKGWTYGSKFILRALQRGINNKQYALIIEQLLKNYWQSSSPDMLISLIPNFNGPMFRALRHVHENVPYVTIMTDIADTPPHFWQEEQDQYMICGSDKAERQAKVVGYRAERIIRTSGMILHPRFYKKYETNREAARIALGLKPDVPTAIIMFGGHGSKTSLTILEQLQKCNQPVQSIVMCGHNEKLKKNIESKYKDTCIAIGFTSDVPDYMHLADFFIGKPGPGSVSEAIHMGLPVIVTRNQRTMVQERYNTYWIEEQKLGFIVKSYSEITEAADFLLNENRLAQFRNNARQFNNRAVFEIPNILDQILSGPQNDYSSEPHFQPRVGKTTFLKSPALRKIKEKVFQPRNNAL